MNDNEIEVWMKAIDNINVKESSCHGVSAGAVLINRSGTTEKSPTCPNCKSWIHHWEVLSDEVRPTAGNCPICGCSGLTEKGEKAQIFGCHVTIKDGDDAKVYIAPLCQCCNNKAIGTEMTLKRDITLVKANVAETCAKLK